MNAEKLDEDLARGARKFERSFHNLGTPDAEIKERKSIFTRANSFEILENAFSLAVIEHFCPWV